MGLDTFSEGVGRFGQTFGGSGQDWINFQLGQVKLSKLSAGACGIGQNLCGSGGIGQTFSWRR